LASTILFSKNQGEIMNEELLSILCCPETKQSISEAEKEIVTKANKAIAAKTLKNRGGDRVEGRLDTLLVREDGKYGYPVRNQIPIMLIDEAIELEQFSE
jgi:uncharacterized protein YbaR (Trm112 family)